MKRKILILLFILITPLLMAASYNYSYYGEVIHSSPGHNYITHFDSQNLVYENNKQSLDQEDKYSDPQDLKVFNDQVYLLARNHDKSQDIILLLNEDFEVVETRQKFELTESYKEKVQQEVNNTFDLLEDLFKEILETETVYPGVKLPFDLAEDLIERADTSWESSNPSIITNDGHVNNFGDEEVKTEVELKVQLWGKSETLTFEVTVGTEVDGIQADGEGFNYELDESLNITDLNEAIHSNFDDLIYTDVSSIIENHKEFDNEGKEKLQFEYEGYLFSYEYNFDEESENEFENIKITLIEEGVFENLNKIHGSMFDEIYETKRAKGLTIVESGIYIADTDNGRILKLNHDFEVVDAFFDVEDETFKTHEYKPLKITVDSSERMYVVASGVYEGIIELDSNGDFNRYTGVNPIKLNPLEIFRRFLMTETQKNKLQQFLPTDYTNLAINEKSFIYATAKARDGNPDDMIQLINPKGIDVLKRNGYHIPIGDVMYVENRNNYVVDGPSDLVDIAIGKNGIYSVLDNRRSRVFTYDSEGNLLYIDGDKGEQSDKFNRGIALEYFGSNMLVLDDNGTIIVYRPNEFGMAVNEAVEHHSNGEFEKSAEKWQEVLKLNTNYETAYNGIGKYNLRQGDFKEAMKNFKLGHDRYYYSKAFKAHRNEIIKDNFTKFVLVVLLISGSVIGVKTFKKYKKGEN